MAKRRLAAEFAVQVFSDGTIDFDALDHYLWRAIHEGPERALKASRRDAQRKPRRPRTR